MVRYQRLTFGFPKHRVDLWLMPLECLHMTTLELAHSLKEPEIEQLVAAIESKIPEITDYTLSHRAKLVKPLLSYDNQAVALSFLPASDTSYQKRPPHDFDEFTYHHLRRDLYNLCESTGVHVASRYTVPSAHLTIARYMTQPETGKYKNAKLSESSDAAVEWIEQLEKINAWLEKDYWAENSADGLGEWIVGDEVGLDCRKGTLWYGGGTSVRVGRGF